MTQDNNAVDQNDANVQKIIINKKKDVDLRKTLLKRSVKEKMKKAEILREIKQEVADFVEKEPVVVKQEILEPSSEPLANGSVKRRRKKKVLIKVNENAVNYPKRIVGSLNRVPKWFGSVRCGARGFRPVKVPRSFKALNLILPDSQKQTSNLPQNSTLQPLKKRCVCNENSVDPNAKQNGSTDSEKATPIPMEQKNVPSTPIKLQKRRTLLTSNREFILTPAEPMEENDFFPNKQPELKKLPQKSSSSKPSRTASPATCDSSKDDKNPGDLNDINNLPVGTKLLVKKHKINADTFRRATIVHANYSCSDEDNPLNGRRIKLQKEARPEAKTDANSTKTVYYIHYEGMDRRMDEWIDPSEIIKVISPDDSANYENQNSNSEKGAHDTRLSRRRQGIHQSVDESAAYAECERQHADNTAMKNIDVIQLGPDIIRCWYFSPYPPEMLLENFRQLYICDNCLMYYARADMYSLHLRVCIHKTPPGTPIYVANKFRVYEVIGAENEFYCESLCLLSKLFLDHKTLFYNVELFYFYVICEVDEYGKHSLVGHFSKENFSSNNVACILVLPTHQRKGYGKFLIQLSYALSIREGFTGTPEKPLSDLGRCSYVTYWFWIIINTLEDEEINANLSIEDVCELTGIAISDIYTTFESTQLIKCIKGKNYLTVNPEIIAEAKKSNLFREPPILLDVNCIRWTKRYSIRRTSETSEDDLLMDLLDGEIETEEDIEKQLRLDRPGCEVADAILAEDGFDFLDDIDVDEDSEEYRLLDKLGDLLNIPKNGFHDPLETHRRPEKRVLSKKDKEAMEFCKEIGLNLKGKKRIVVEVGAKNAVPEKDDESEGFDFDQYAPSGNLMMVDPKTKKLVFRSKAEVTASMRKQHEKGIRTVVLERTSPVPRKDSDDESVAEEDEPMPPAVVPSPSCRGGGRGRVMRGGPARHGGRPRLPIRPNAPRPLHRFNGPRPKIMNPSCLPIGFRLPNGISIVTPPPPTNIVRTETGFRPLNPIYTEQFNASYQQRSRRAPKPPRPSNAPPSPYDLPLKCAYPIPDIVSNSRSRPRICVRVEIPRIPNAPCLSHPLPPPRLRDDSVSRKGSCTQNVFRPPNSLRQLFPPRPRPSNTSRRPSNPAPRPQKNVPPSKPPSSSSSQPLQNVPSPLNGIPSPNPRPSTAVSPSPPPPPPPPPPPNGLYSSKNPSSSSAPHPQNVRRRSKTRRILVPLEGVPSTSTAQDLKYIEIFEEEEEDFEDDYHYDDSNFSSNNTDFNTNKMVNYINDVEMTTLEAPQSNKSDLSSHSSSNSVAYRASKSRSTSSDLIIEGAKDFDYIDRKELSTLEF